MRFIYTISRYLVGLLFIFSGGIKINDPVGTQIKLQEYFEVFSDFFKIIQKTKSNNDFRNSITIKSLRLV